MLIFDRQCCDHKDYTTNAANAKRRENQKHSSLGSTGLGEKFDIRHKSGTSVGWVVSRDVKVLACFKSALLRSFGIFFFFTFFFFLKRYFLFSHVNPICLAVLLYPTCATYTIPSSPRSGQHPHARDAFTLHHRPLTARSRDCVVSRIHERRADASRFDETPRSEFLSFVFSPRRSAAGRYAIESAGNICAGMFERGPERVRRAVESRSRALGRVRRRRRRRRARNDAPELIERRAALALVGGRA